MADQATTLRGRLVDLRDDTLRQLTALDYPDAGLLRLLGDANAALAAIDARPPEGESADRVALADDGETLRLTSYTQSGAVATVVLDPRQAIAIAGKLLDAAGPKLRSNG
jgi:hypothetical protein